MENHLKLVKHILTDETINTEEKLNLINQHFSKERIQEVDNLLMLAENLDCDISAGNFDITVNEVDTDFYAEVLGLNRSTLEIYQ